MYAWYTRKDENGQTQFELTSGAALAGCEGIIANELSEIVTAKDTNPFGWTIPVAEKWNKQNYLFVIDIRPNSSETFLCGVDRAFGYCLDAWTLVILWLKLILNSDKGFMTIIVTLECSCSGEAYAAVPEISPILCVVYVFYVLSGSI